MAFTDWAGQIDIAKAAKARAIANNNLSRDQLRMQYGLNQDNTVNASDTLGSIYQTGANASQQYAASLAQQVGRGLGTGGGLGARGRNAARTAGQEGQASLVRSADLGFRGLTASDSAAGVDYDNTVASVGRYQADELAQKLIANPVQTPQAATPTQYDPRFTTVGTPGGSAIDYAKLYASNPKKYQTIKGKF